MSIFLLFLFVYPAISVLDPVESAPNYSLGLYDGNRFLGYYDLRSGRTRDPVYAYQSKSTFRSPFVDLVGNGFGLVRNIIGTVGSIVGHGISALGRFGQGVGHSVVALSVPPNRRPVVTTLPSDLVETFVPKPPAATTPISPPLNAVKLPSTSSQSVSSTAGTVSGLGNGVMPENSAPIPETSETTLEKPPLA